MEPSSNGHGGPAQDREVQDSLAHNRAEADAVAAQDQSPASLAAPTASSPAPQPASADVKSMADKPAEASAEAEKRIADLEAEVSQLKEARAAMQKSLSDSQSRDASRYRDLVLSAYPDLPAELVSGATVEEVEASVERARAVVQKVKERLAQQPPAPPVGGGAPVRAEPDTASMSPIEKIRYAISRRK